MALMESLTSNFGVVFQGMVGLIGIFLGLGVLGAILAGIWFLYMKWYRYQQYKCLIFYEDALGNTGYKWDRAGVFMDSKTKNKLFFIKGANVGLNPDNIPFIKEGKKRIVWLFQSSLKGFSYIRPYVGNPGLHLDYGEIDLNWGTNTYERVKRSLMKAGFMQYLPYIIWAVTVIGMLILFVNLFKQLGTFATVAQATREAAVALKEAAAAQAGVMPG